MTLICPEASPIPAPVLFHPEMNWLPPNTPMWNVTRPSGSARNRVRICGWYWIVLDVVRPSCVSTKRYRPVSCSCWTSTQRRMAGGGSGGGFSPAGRACAAADAAVRTPSAVNRYDTRGRKSTANIMGRGAPSP